MTRVTLRRVEASDLPLFYAHQADPEACAMADFLPRDEAAFYGHWTRILHEPSLVARTVLADGEVAGNVVSWTAEGHRNVGYWLGRAWWGRGVATQALARLLDEVRERPLHARVARRNAASIRVLEKNGFVLVEAGEREVLLRLG